MPSLTKLHIPGPLQIGQGKILTFSVWYKALLGCGFLKAVAGTVLKIGMHFLNFVLPPPVWKSCVMGGSNMQPAIYKKGPRKHLHMQNRGSLPMLFLFQFLSNSFAELITVLLLCEKVPNKPKLAMIVITEVETVGGTVLGTAS